MNILNVTNNNVLIIIGVVFMYVSGVAVWVEVKRKREKKERVVKKYRIIEKVREVRECEKVSRREEKVK